MTYNLEAPAEWFDTEKEVGIDQQIENAEKDRKQREAEVLASVIELLEKPENRLGGGGTAEVFFPDNNTDVCYKIIRKVDIPTVRLMDKMPLKLRKYINKTLPWHRSLTQEAEYLQKASELAAESDVQVPKPHVVFHLESSNEINGVEFMERVDVLVMERIHGENLEETLRKDEMTFTREEIDSGMRKLEGFFKKTHEGGLHHRDVAERNIMVKRNGENGDIEWSVIDFGRSIVTQENPYEQERVKDGDYTMLLPTSDLDGLRIIRKHLIQATDAKA